MKIKVKVWIEDDEENLIFGSGKTEVLETIEEKGSISKAAESVGMNYKKAWNHIKVLEKFIEEDLVITNKGRGEDSGTKLTSKAKELIALYKNLENEIINFSNEEFKKSFLDKNLIQAKGDKDV